MFLFVLPVCNAASPMLPLNMGRMLDTGIQIRMIDILLQLFDFYQLKRNNTVFRLCLRKQRLGNL